VETSIALSRRLDETRRGQALERQRLFSLGVGLLALSVRASCSGFARRDRA